ncbi:MAG: sensor histidine kinase [Thermoanaerobaculia bacterium]
MTSQPQTSAGPRGLGLPTKLTLGFVVLLAILIAVGVESISLLDRLGGSIDVILREGYKSNITLPGEGNRAARLQRPYPTFQQIKQTTDEILWMNERNMVEANDRARKAVAGASRSMAIALLAGTAFAGLAVFLLSRAILGPLERMTRAAREIGGGNLDLTVPVTSRDELGQLAAAFNSMAGGLRELRETDQSRLLRARRISQSTIDRLPEAVAVVSPERKVELANQPASSQLGLWPGEPLPERHCEWLLPLLERVESGRLPAGGAEAVVRLAAEGRERLYRPRGTVLRDGQGRVDALVVVLEDVTDLLRGSEVNAGLLANTARDVERSLGPLREALESLGAERIGPLTPRQKQRVEAAQAEVGRLGEIAASLLATSTLEESRHQLHLEPVLPGDLVDAAVRNAGPGFQEDGVSLSADVDPKAPRILADRERVRQVLTALLKNARAHSSAGNAVTVTAEPWEGRVRFTVTDTGSGVPAAHRQRIFEPFYQVPDTQDLGGVGLGLAVARGVVQAHGGEIRCEGEEGRGAVFWFTLPAAAGNP